MPSLALLCKVSIVGRGANEHVSAVFGWISGAGRLGNYLMGLHINSMRKKSESRGRLVLASRRA